MIPATSFLVDDDTALVVVEADLGDWSDWWQDNNRPCDTCWGSGRLRENAADPYGRPCPDCVDGRHTFDITVSDGNTWCNSWTVHVIDVLPIHDWCPDEKPANHICHAWKAGQQSEQWWHHRSFDRDDWTEREITLPPDATPGKWLVRLAVHQ